MIPLPRVVYAMAKDGLICRCLSSVHPKFKTPWTATLVTGVAAGLLALITDLDSLVEMMSIGTLLAYTLVAISILILRSLHYTQLHNSFKIEMKAFFDSSIKFTMNQFNFNLI